MAIEYLLAEYIVKKVVPAVEPYLRKNYDRHLHRFKKYDAKLESALKFLIKVDRILNGRFVTYLGAPLAAGLIFLLTKVYPILFPGGLNRWWINFVGIPIILVFSIVLYFFKRIARRAYGFVEIVFSIAIGWVGISKLHDAGIGEWAAIIGAIYFGVRGLDNALSAKESEKNLVVADGPPATL